jgi:glycosyltransferase involved in cell wall biosynthesis
MSTFFSITIPTYGYNGRGGDFLEFSFEKIKSQTFSDFEVIISDHSIDDTIKNICDKWSESIDIKYYRNEHGRGIISPNINVAMSKANGKWIKILFQDDFLYDENSLQKQYEFIIKNHNMNWFLTEFFHSNTGYDFYRQYTPMWHENVWRGNNTLGCPSGLTIKNENILYFDENLNWLMDCDYYQKLFLKYGPPFISSDITVVNRTWGERLTDTIPNEIRNQEHDILSKRYGQ